MRRWAKTWSPSHVAKLALRAGFSWPNEALKWISPQAAEIHGRRWIPSSTRRAVEVASTVAKHAA
jgi:hypothetical protein